MDHEELGEGGEGSYEIVSGYSSLSQFSFPCAGDSSRRTPAVRDCREFKVSCVTLGKPCVGHLETAPEVGAFPG